MSLRFTEDGSIQYIPSVDVTEVWNEAFELGKKEAEELAQTKIDIAVAEKEAAENDAAAAREACATKHFVKKITMEADSLALSFEVPFNPDTVLVICCTGVQGAGYLQLYARDVRSEQNVDAIGSFAAVSVVKTNDDGSTRQDVHMSGYSPASAKGKPSYDESTHIAEIKNVIYHKDGSAAAAKFGKGLEYLVVCEKHT